jgi:biopolymer transport protein ExbD
MADRSTSILPPHARPWRPSFVLTSLIDVIFLLVIFFMVSSQIVPFSLLPLSQLAAESAGAASAASEVAAPPVAVRILAGQVTIGGNRVPMPEVAAAFADLKSRGVTAILLIPSMAATVQDVVSVLEASKAAALESVTVLSRRSAQP